MRGHGLEAERVRHLAIAVLTNPSHSLARGLLGLVEHQGKWKRPEAVAEALKNDVARADLIAKYNGKRVETPVKAAPQYKLGLWCEENGLKDEARAHFATVVRLDPKHADAWKKLGYKKVGDRWLTDAQATALKAEKEAQDQADKHWRPRLEKLRDTLAAKGKHEAAEKTLSETYRITLDGRPIISSSFHRFWKAGRGWVMARDLQVGDAIRTLGGVARITAIEADKVQPVFNLDVAGDADFFAGDVAALVHDNTLPDLKQVPFDAPPTFAVAKP